MRATASHSSALDHIAASCFGHFSHIAVCLFLLFTDSICEKNSPKRNALTGKIDILYTLIYPHSLAQTYTLSPSLTHSASIPNSHPIHIHTHTHNLHSLALFPLLSHLYHHTQVHPPRTVSKYPPTDSSTATGWHHNNPPNANAELAKPDPPPPLLLLTRSRKVSPDFQSELLPSKPSPAIQRERERETRQAGHKHG